MSRALVLLLASVSPAFAQEGADALPDWVKHTRITGSVNTGYYEGKASSPFAEGAFNVYDFRLFIDVELGENVMAGSTKLFQNVGLTFEWDLIRLTSLANRVGECYVDFQGVAASKWFNVQLGRFQIPVTENYLRFSKGYKDNPFISSTLGAPWYWDEGLRMYGSAADGSFGYLASLSDGDTALNNDSDQEKQATLKLWFRPTDWAYISASGLNSGQLGNPTTAAGSAVWFGESFARQFGAGSTLANFNQGVAVVDGPNELKGVRVVGVDTVLTYADFVRAWLAYGLVYIRQDGDNLYDRDLKYWVAEVVIEGKGVSDSLSAFYLGLRSDWWGSVRNDEGYLLDLRYSGLIGYNMQSMAAASMVVGWRMTPKVRLRLEYTMLEIKIVSGATPAIENEGGDADYFAIECAVDF